MMLEDAARCLQINFCEFILISNQKISRVSSKHKWRKKRCSNCERGRIS